MYWRFLNVLMMTLYVEARVLQRKRQNKVSKVRNGQLTRIGKRIPGEPESDLP